MQIAKIIEKYNILWYYLNMEYKLIRSRRKTLAIKISDMAEIIVLAPNKCSLQYIDKFVSEKQNWIVKTQSRVLENREKIKQYKVLDKIYLFGYEYNVIDYGNHYMIGDYYIKHSKSANKTKVVKDFFVKLANNYIVERTKKISEIINIDFSNIKIISARKKWGSCNNLKELRFNFRLVMIPKELIDYVICHELCHIKELNHSKEFWNLLEKFGYKKTTVKQQFNEYNFVLQLL